MYQVTYIREAWSRDSEEEDYGNETMIECGLTESVERFIEGVYPGKYLFEDVTEDSQPSNSFHVIVGVAPPTDGFMDWLAQLPSGQLIDLLMNTFVGDVGKHLIRAYTTQTNGNKRAAASE
jgi:hypothetical protein